MIQRIAVWIGIFLSFAAHAQDFSCRVQVIDPTNNQNYKNVFQAMQQACTEFYNTRKWTIDNLQASERIECNVIITIKTIVSADEFEATFQVQSSRPIYGTNYSSVLLNYMDEEFRFKYAEFQSMDFNENQYSSLTSMLAFYANIILGLDYDSFSPEGGTLFFTKAQQIVNAAQTAGEPGWTQPRGTRTKSRYLMIDNLMSARFKPLREGLYKYHRLGLDVMTKDNEAARTVISEVVFSLQKLAQQVPNSAALRLFFDAKSSELVEIFKMAAPNEKTKIVEALKQADIVNASKYDKILK